MNHIAITFIKWSFLAIGVAMLFGAALLDGSAAIVLALLGFAFASVGGGIIYYGRWSAQKEARLRQHGRLVQAEFQQVELNGALEVNGTNPFRIIAQWHDAKSNQLFIFKSANLWFDPSRFVEGRKIPVYVDLRKPTNYHVDLSFLPKVHG